MYWYYRLRLEDEDWMKVVLDAQGKKIIVPKKQPTKKTLRRGMRRRMVRLRKKKGKLRKGKPTTKQGKKRVK